VSITEKAFVVENDDEPNGTDTTTGILPSGVQRFQEIDWVYHISILRFLGFGHYLREWKGFPVLLSPLEQFCGIEVTFLWDCMK
jgi:hypothetical protein